MTDPAVSRRSFLARAALVAAAAPLASRLLTQPARAADLPPLAPDNPTAVALAYSEDAAGVKHAVYKPGSTCANCQFYTGAADASRGPCSLFPNFSVASKGWCAAWAAKA